MSKALGALGLKGVKFGMHSFWTEAASLAAAMGYSLARIKETGHWKLTAYKGYVYPVQF